MFNDRVSEVTMLCSHKTTEKWRTAFCAFLPDVTQEVPSYEFKFINISGKIWKEDFLLSSFINVFNGNLDILFLPTSLIRLFIKPPIRTWCLYAKLRLILLSLNSMANDSRSSQVAGLILLLRISKIHILNVLCWSILPAKNFSSPLPYFPHAQIPQVVYLHLWILNTYLCCRVFREGNILLLVWLLHINMVF